VQIIRIPPSPPDKKELPVRVVLFLSDGGIRSLCPGGVNPSFSANKKTSFVMWTKEVFLNDVCLRQMMLAAPMMFHAEMMSLR